MSALRRVLDRFHALRARRWVRLLMDGVLIIVVFSAVSLWQTRHHTRGDVRAFALPVLGGGDLTLASLGGKPTLVVFWAPWCGVCHANADNVARVASWAGDRAHVVSIASDYRSEDEVRRTAEREELPRPILLGGTATARAWGVTAFPTFFFLDADGHVTSSVAGYTTTAGLAARLLLDGVPAQVGL